MDELSRYLLDNYSQLLTQEEKAASSVIGNMATAEAARQLADKASHKKRRELLKLAEALEANVKVDSKNRVLLDDGKARFYSNISARLLREHGGDIILNRCPKCGSLCRTPKAKQCSKCFRAWHDTNSE